MSLQVVVAAPFRQRGRERLAESEVIVALSLDRDWFSPDQAARVIDRAVGEGLLGREGDDLLPQFDPRSVEVPAGFTPAEDLLRDPSPFERVVEALVEAGMEKREAVAGINRLQADLGLTVGAAAVVYARRQGVAVPGAVRSVRADLGE